MPTANIGCVSGSLISIDVFGAKVAVSCITLKLLIDSDSDGAIWLINE